MWVRDGGNVIANKINKSLLTPSACYCEWKWLHRMISKNNFPCLLDQLVHFHDGKFLFLGLDGKSIFHLAWPRSPQPFPSPLTSSSYRHRAAVYSHMCPSSSQQARCLSLRIIFSHVDAAFACWEIAPICPSSQSRMNRANNSQGGFGLMEMRAASPLGCTDIAIILLMQYVLLDAGADMHCFQTNTPLHM